MSNRQVDLTEALARIKSSRATERSVGLRDLKHLLDHSTNSSQVSKLKDKSIHVLLEDLFSAVSAERSNWMRSSSKSKASSGSKLESFGEAFRSLTTSLCPRFRLKSLQGIFSHVLQALPDQSGSLCVPLALNYLKSLTVVLGYTPHVEHLSSEDWSSFVDVCVNAISHHVDSSAASISVVGGSVSTNGVPDRTALRSSIEVHSHTQQDRGPSWREEGQLLIKSLALLTEATNSPLIGRAHIIFRSLIAVSAKLSLSAAAAIDTFKAINNVLRRMTFDSVSFMKRATRPLIRLIKSQWATKDSLLRDELLKTLVLLQPFLCEFESADQIEGHILDLDALHESLLDDYLHSNSRDRRHIQLEDLRLSTVQFLDVLTSPLQNSTLALHRSTVESEHNWVLLSVLADLTLLIDRLRARSTSSSTANDSNGPRKRQKQNRKYPELLRLCGNVNDPSHVFAMQVVAFITNRAELDQSVLDESLGVITSIILSADPELSSWSLLALAGCATKKSSDHAKMKPVWINAWQTALRLMSSVLHSRAASHLLSVILLADVVGAEDVTQDLELLAENGGSVLPANVTDASINFLIQSGALLSSVSSNAMVTKYTDTAVGWLFSNWSPSNFETWAYSLQMSQTLGLLDISGFFYYICFGMRPPNVSSFPKLGALGRVCLHQINTSGLTWYLLACEEQRHSAKLPFASSCQRPPLPALSNNARVAIETKALDFLLIEVGKVTTLWQAAVAERSRATNPEPFSVVLSLGLVANIFCHMSRHAGSSRIDRLREASHNLIQQLSAYTATFKSTEPSHEVVLDALWAILPGAESLRAIPASVSTTYLSRESTQMLYDALMAAHHNDGIQDGEDDFDNDFPGLGQDSQQIDSQHDLSWAYRDHLSSTASTQSFASCTLAFTAYALRRPTDEDDDDDQAVQVSASLVNHLLELPPSALMACKPLLKLLGEAECLFTSTDAGRLLAYAAEVFLPEHDYRLSEAVIQLCVQLLQMTMHLWTSTADSEVSRVAFDVYEWLTNMLVKERRLSASSQIAMSEMLFALLKMDQDYGAQQRLPSVRKMLLETMKRGEIPVQFAIAEQIPTLFGLFVYSTHSKILNDILDNLPNDMEWTEGIALRLAAFSKLAESWNTLLRTCVYRIVETVGSIPRVSQHGKLCVSRITSALGLSSSRELFATFRAHLVVLWMDHNQSIDSFPYAIFSFASLEEFFEAAASDVAPRLLTQEETRDRDRVGTVMQISASDLLLKSFCRSVACAFGTDLAASTAGKSMSYAAETKLRDIMGSQDQLNGLIAKGFPSILGHIFARVDSEDSIKKVLERRKGYEVANKIFTALQMPDSGQEYLPPNLQPCYKSHHLIECIERLSRRAGRTSLSIWSPSTAAQVTRTILDEVHPALGALQARRTLRKLRILIALAGSSCFIGYALEQLLHSIRPFISDKQCSQDAIPLFKYLLQNGLEYLRERPSFVAGTCVALNLEVRGLFGWRSDSTTDESSLRATVSSADDFHEWLSAWSEKFEQQANISLFAPKNFHLIMSLSRSRLSHGTSQRDSLEGRLLHCLFADMKSTRRILSTSFTNLCLGLLCGQDFEPSKTIEEDVLGSIELADRYSSPVWESCRSHAATSQYLRWAAKTLGRAFQHRGRIPSQASIESTLHEKRVLSTIQTDINPSSAAILRVLAQMLEDGKPSLVSLAENTIRRILANIKDTEERHMMQQCLGSHIGEDLHSEAQHSISPSASPALPRMDIKLVFESAALIPFDEWTRQLILGLIERGPKIDFMCDLIPALKNSDILTERLFPFVLHSVLEASALLQDRGITDVVSDGFRHCFQETNEATSSHVRLLVNTLLYLRTRSHPYGETKFDRNRWLNIDFSQASVAARDSSMFKTALLFTELDQSLDGNLEVRRSSKVVKPFPDDLLLSIFREIDEPDSFHGVRQQPSLDSVIDRLAFEGGGVKELLLRGARVDGVLKAGHRPGQSSFAGMVSSLISLNMSSLAGQISGASHASPASGAQSMAEAAIKLRQWDIPTPRSDNSDVSCLYSALQSIHACSTLKEMTSSINESAAEVLARMSRAGRASKPLRSGFSTLAALNDLDEILQIKSAQDLSDVTSRLHNRQHWMVLNPAEDAATVLLARESAFGILSTNKVLQQVLHVDESTARLAEAQTNLQSSIIHREQESLQEALANVAYLTECVQPCRELGIGISAAVQAETSHVLWAQGELIPSIRILQHLTNNKTSDEALQLSRGAILATLGSHVSEARLEKPDEVMRNYLARAVDVLRKTSNSSGKDAGQVYHEFATYCHTQLTSSENVAEYQRSEQSRHKRLSEIRDLDQILKSKLDDHSKHRAKSDRNKAKKWFDIDAKENERLTRNREHFMRQSLDAYLHGLASSNEHDTDVLRFLALWLEHASNDAANASVHRLSEVPSLKFAPLMNQLASRLQDSDDKFQTAMSMLVERICTEHPHHSMCHIYAGSRTSGGNDRTAISRNQAALKLANRLAASSQTSDTWSRLCRANDIYINLATAKSEAFKAGVRIELRKNSAARALERDIPALQVMPITLNIPLRADLDYKDVPIVSGFKSTMSIAGGLSAPKVLTALASDGSQCKQLFKAGADDLRQDAIMEQVFGQVSSLLQTQKDTRQRQLHIRTYKVVPLDATSGAMEFVQNTQPLNDFLRYAHAKYYPKDYKWDTCRQKVDEVRTRSPETRIDVYGKLTANFRPVLRHFFFERFDDPDEWFNKRLAYTRSTAAISILGHALGLGDRHCQNILLDTQTGEVVHIDLGVAFEAGRILTVPEVVPFRLTRDIVDGFGIMGVEGVYRRCSEFTLTALRQSRDAVMTLLNVLRYDPLYSWSMSPLRARRLQQGQEEEEGPGTAQSEGAKTAPPVEDESGEADRALSVVERKLAPSLSVQATVNELIQQATDEKNLALLFCGWAAFA